MIVTDSQLNILEKGPDLIIHYDKDSTEMKNMNEWCQNHSSEVKIDSIPSDEPFENYYFQ